VNGEDSGADVTCGRFGHSGPGAVDGCRSTWCCGASRAEKSLSRVLWLSDGANRGSNVGCCSGAIDCEVNHGEGAELAADM
jgi:hypothetical protein